MQMLQIHTHTLPALRVAFKCDTDLICQQRRRAAERRRRWCIIHCWRKNEHKDVLLFFPVLSERCPLLVRAHNNTDLVSWSLSQHQLNPDVLLFNIQTKHLLTSQLGVQIEIVLLETAVTVSFWASGQIRLTSGGGMSHKLFSNSVIRSMKVSSCLNYLWSEGSPTAS